MSTTIGQQHFTVTEDHLKLARQMWVRWDEVEFGAPAVDSKRPYGNSDVLNDMREVLDRDEPDDVLERLHAEMETVLQIGLATGRFEVGDYTARQYSIDWAPATTEREEER